MKKKFFLAAAVFSVSHSFAQFPVSTADSTLLLENVIITANKIEQKQVETGKVLTVITRDELQQNAGRSLGEILNRQVGITIGGAAGTPGSVQSVYVRGASTANTLILVDGVPMFDASGISSEFDLNTFMPADIERIEILKGAQSTIYGSDAVAGVINIISRKSSAKGIAVQSELSGGSYGTFRGSVLLSGTNKQEVTYKLGYTKFYSNGFSSANDSSKKGNFDNDGVNQDEFLGSIGCRFNDRLQANAYIKYNRSKGGIDVGAYTDDRDYHFGIKNLITGLRFDYKLRKGGLHFNFYRNEYSRSYNNDSGDIGGYSTDPFAYYLSYSKESYKGYSHFAEVFMNIPLNANLSVVAGTDYRIQSTSQDYLYVSNFGLYEPVPLRKGDAVTSQLSAYASFLYSKKGFNLGLGGRVNGHSEFGNNGTFSFNPSYFSGKNKFFINIASAYRIPSLYQLYSEYGNTDLRPEQSLSYEAGVERKATTWNARLTLFNRDIRNVFIFYTDPVTFLGKYLNEDRQLDNGFEADFTVKPLKHFSFTGNFTYVDGALTTKDALQKDTSYFNLYHRPRSVLNVHADYRAKKCLFSVHLRKSSSSIEYVYGASPVRLPGYYTLDLYGEYAMNDHFRLFVDSRNITDSRYFELIGFNTRRFNIMAGLQMSF